MTVDDILNEGQTPDETLPVDSYDATRQRRLSSFDAAIGAISQGTATPVAPQSALDPIAPTVFQPKLPERNFPALPREIVSAPQAFNSSQQFNLTPPPPQPALPPIKPKEELFPQLPRPRY